VIDVDEGHVHRREGFDFIDGIFGRWLSREAPC
jgi:hypothetical protein